MQGIGLARQDMTFVKSSDPDVFKVFNGCSMLELNELVLVKYG